MTETPASYGGTPALSRFSETQLAEIQAKARELLAGIATATHVPEAMTEASFATLSERLVDEVRRYRALLVAIARFIDWERRPSFASDIVAKLQKDLVAELAAIRAERR